METPLDTFGIARDAREQGIVAIPIISGTKVPAVKWKEWQTKMPPLELQREWFRERCNIAIITTGMVVFDIDDPQRVELVLTHCGDTPHKLKTPGGGTHLGYRKRKCVAVTNQVKIKGMLIDVRTDRGLELIPNSETEKGRYEWLGDGLFPIADLPLARVGWTRKRTRKQCKAAVTFSAPGGADAETLFHRGRHYVDRLPEAISGQNGHTTTFVAALKIARLSGFDREIAWQLLCYYNATKCKPEWTEKDLRHKLEDALRLAT